MTARPVILSIDQITVEFDQPLSPLERMFSQSGRSSVLAVDNVDFEVERGTTFALVGESGCGKTTLARTIVGVQRPTRGSVSFMGVDIAGFRTRHAALPYRRNLQMIFQDPFASLNPRWRVGRIIAEPILTHNLMRSGPELDAKVRELLEKVGLAPDDAHKLPHQFSGGQRQRISIARALATNPALIVCDEPTSALDVSVQAQILNLMRQLQRELGLSYLLISHNLAVVANMADRLGVMYLGRLVEQGDASQIFDNPMHPYTRMLLDTVPDPHSGRRLAHRQLGELPNPVAAGSGCAFQPRCSFANARCGVEVPASLQVGQARVACHAVEERRLPPASSQSPGDHMLARHSNPQGDAL